MAEQKLWALILKKPAAEVQAFLNTHEGPLNLEAKDRKGRTPLHVAAIRKSRPLVEALLDKKANVDAEDLQGSSPLHIAAGIGALEAVEALVSRGANIFKLGAGKSPQCWATDPANDIAKLIGVKSSSLIATGRTAAAASLAATAAQLLTRYKCDIGFSDLKFSEDINTPEVVRGFGTCDAKLFQVRQPNYEKEKKKAPSEQSFYDVHTVELFQAGFKIRNVVQYLNLPSLPHHLDEEKNAGLEGIPHYFALMVMLPDYEPSMFGGATDGKSYQFLVVFKLSEYGQQALREGKTAPARLLSTFLRSDVNGDQNLRARLKAIAILTNPTEIKCSSMVRSLIVQRNGQPFMTGPRCHTFYRGSNYLEVNCDVHTFCYLARKGFYSIKGPIAMDGSVIFGVVVEGKGAEQPEQMLGTATIKKVNLPDVPHWDTLCEGFVAAGKAREAASASASEPAPGPPQ
jgi:hypothetical protein